LALWILAALIGVADAPCYGQGIQQLSVVSLYLVCPVPGTDWITTGTGFVVTNKTGKYLISNWHVLSGRTWPSGALENSNGVPTNVIVFYHSKKLGTWTPISEPLYSGEGTNGSPLWLEHSLGGKKIDVVALPLEKENSEVSIYPMDMHLADTDLSIQPATTVSVIGFPGVLSKPRQFPIWKTGNIASEPELDYNGMPVVLVGVVIRPGMSGSPVIAHCAGTYQSRSGDTILNSGFVDRFVGVLSGNMDGEIALVWKPRVITEIIERGKKPATRELVGAPQSE
jgi:hypothetical protein